VDITNDAVRVKLKEDTSGSRPSMALRIYHQALNKQDHSNANGQSVRFVEIPLQHEINFTIP
jgi:hypothetical protein